MVALAIAVLTAACVTLIVIRRVDECLAVCIAWFAIVAGPYLLLSDT